MDAEPSKRKLSSSSQALPPARVDEFPDTQQDDKPHVKRARFSDPGIQEPPFAGVCKPESSASPLHAAKPSAAVSWRNFMRSAARLACFQWLLVAVLRLEDRWPKSFWARARARTSAAAQIPWRPASNAAKRSGHANGRALARRLACLRRRMLKEFTHVTGR